MPLREFGVIYAAYWSRTSEQGWSDDAKLLGAYLMTCTHGTIAGICKLPDGYVAEDLKWSSERVRKGFQELSKYEFADRCETTNWVWIRKFLEWNRPENPNQWKAVRKAVGQVSNRCAWFVDLTAFMAVLAGDSPPSPGNPSPTVPEEFRNLIPSQPIPPQQETKITRIQNPIVQHETEPQIYERILGIKAKYPKAAREDWTTAEKLMRQLVTGGDATWESIEAGIERYGRLVKATNRIVLNPARYFGDVDRPWAQEWPLPVKPEPDAPKRTWRPPPDEPGAKAC